MLKLYNHSTSVCAQKVRMTLNEKQLPWDEHYVNLAKGEQNDPEYLKLNPNALVPTLIHDHRVIIESTVINEYLDETFPDVRLRPPDAYGKALMRIWTKQIDDSIHLATTTVTFAIALRWRYQTQTLEEINERIRQIPSIAKRKRIREGIDLGVDAPNFGDAVLRMHKMVAAIDKALADRPWLLGDEITLADLNHLPYAYRLEHLSLEGMFEPYPAFTDWYNRLKSRPSFSQSIRDMDKDPDTPRFRDNGRDAWPTVAQILENVAN